MSKCGMSEKIVNHEKYSCEHKSLTIIVRHRD